MYSSNINGENQLLPQFQPSFYSSTSHFGLNGNCSDLHHHHDLLVHHIPGAAASASETALNDLVGLTKPTLSDQHLKSLNGDHHHHHHHHYGASLCNFPKMRVVKKDRHSKIVTAQGPRDRRVRLSIEIAKKFFGLQDMLGFDKASKTLDWLLTNSKTAIEELVKMKDISANNMQSSVSECEETMGIEAAENGGDSDGKPWENSTKLLQPENQAQKVARESSRANARARARERTRKKMRTMAEKPSVRSPFVQNQSLPASSQTAASKRSDSPIGHTPTIQEPLLIYRKMKPSSTCGLQPNLVVSNNAKSENHVFPFNTGNLDTTSSIARSTMYAMANINSSKVLQLCGIPFGSINNNGGH